VRAVVDTNVFVSGVFFSGPPHQILNLWRDGKFGIVLSEEIFEEYQRVGEEMADQFPAVDLAPILELLSVEAALVLAPSLAERVCQDPHDDKFLACALAGRARVIVSGDKHLLNVSGYKGIRVVRPRTFIEEYRNT
jgi:putative PIN family toxin of toxin-antitoxin system